MRNLLIYRHQLFKPSEVFISSQADALRRFKPVYTGRVSNLPSARSRKAVATLEGANRFDIMRNIALRDPTPFEKLARAYSPALIHAHFGVEGLYAVGIAKRLQVPLVTTFHGFDATITRSALLRSCKPAWIHYALFRNRLARHGNLFICVSDYIRKRILAAGFPKERVVRHYIGIDTETIRPPDKHISNGTIVHVARLVEKKGTRFLIEAFHRIAGIHREAKLLIVGDGPLRPSLEALVCSYELNNRVLFLGACSNQKVLELMSEAAVFCLPSVTSRTGDQEGLGMVILEAAAMAVPTVGTLSGGIPEVIREGETGYLVPERNVDALADRLLLILENKTLRREMGQAARQMAVENFNLKRQTATLEDLYETLL